VAAKFASYRTTPLEAEVSPTGDNSLKIVVARFTKPHDTHGP
jgi:hypothetical protein